MDAAAAPLLVAARATSILVAAASQSSHSDPTRSPSNDHMLYYHGATPASSGGSDGNDNGECKLLGPFSLLVQLALGALALLSLVYKRWRERPQRPLKVWAFDVSKQVFGSAMLHLLNLVMSMFSAGQLEIRPQYKPNPCSFYLLNLGIDTTLGIPILILVLRFLNFLAAYTPLANPPESIESGNYGQPPRAFWWFKQSIIYFVGLISMKICVFFLIQLLPFIVKLGDWALQWTEGNTAIQIAFVMLLFPVIMNAIQYYIIDIFIKKPLSYNNYTSDDTTDDSTTDSERREALLDGIDENYSDTDVEDTPSRKSSIAKSQPRDTTISVQESEGHLLEEDQSPVPPYEPPSSGSSHKDHGNDSDATPRPQH
ncbi:hypothetical protein N7532_003356 [Penicillium argentinense]|uniref:Vacuolar membrane protein n=1 Tax=Penicillium argentinense TaxID=1131581 RepID=A0A9W9KF50_9EURO|nr:uncharacterized protein N7532_003356 [Penicillium argentinense]KAJ5102827.1 hypothetical protein N7532_003356 [Penicillium argentinense]